MGKPIHGYYNITVIEFIGLIVIGPLLLFGYLILWLIFKIDSLYKNTKKKIYERKTKI